MRCARASGRRATCCVWSAVIRSGAVLLLAATCSLAVLCLPLGARAVTPPGASARTRLSGEPASPAWPKPHPSCVQSWVLRARKLCTGRRPSLLPHVHPRWRLFFPLLCRPCPHWRRRPCSLRRRAPPCRWLLLRRRTVIPLMSCPRLLSLLLRHRRRRPAAAHVPTRRQCGTAFSVGYRAAGAAAPWPRSLSYSRIDIVWECYVLALHLLSSSSRLVVRS